VIIKLKGVQRTYEQVNEWVNAMSKKYEYKDINEAFALLKATLCTLRDRLPVNEAVHLGAQLPVLLRGYYYEDWVNNKVPTKEHDASAFFSAIRNKLTGYDELNVEAAAPSVLKIIFDKIDQAEIQDVKDNLPKEILNITQ
jgi:uncharacterized protein (DUF2267 family)